VDEPRCSDGIGAWKDSAFLVLNTAVCGLCSAGRFSRTNPALWQWTTLAFLRIWRSAGIMRHMHAALSKSNCRLAAIILLVLFLDSGSCFAGQNTSKKAGPEPTLKCQDDGKLEGKLTDRTIYGAPGMGKDAHERVFLLELTSPITVEPSEGATADSSTCSKTFRHVRQVQLFFDLSMTTETEKMLGKVVVAVGLLDEAHLPSHHTDVIMDVVRLDPK
jgi:hypothetical protein